MQLTACRALISGASGGIGQALVEQLCAGGAQLLLTGRDQAALEALQKRFPTQISLVCADLSQADGRAQVVHAARAFAPLNCLINAAGINQFCLFAEQDEQAIDRLITLNVSAPLQLTRQLLPLLQAQPQALIVNLGSIFGSIGHAGFSTYCVSKFALRGFSEALRRELADSPVRVLYLAPRATRTTMNSARVQAMNEALQVSMDEPQQVARQICQAIIHEQPERYLGWPEKLFVRLNSLLPRLVDKAVRGQLMTIKRFAGRT